MVKRLAVFLAVAAAVAIIAKKVKNARDERELWQQAINEPELNSAHPELP